MTMTATVLLPIPSDLNHGAHYNSATTCKPPDSAPNISPDTIAMGSLGADAGSKPIEYTVKEAPLGTAKHVRIVGIGAGASGINMVRTLRMKLRDNFEHIVYEKNADVGGTWYENRYPGCRCDVPSHNYQFSWRPNSAWTNFFSPAEEIGAYLHRIADDEGMRDSVIKTQHEVVEARWNEARGRWLLTIANLRTGERFDDYADFLIDASGILK